MDTFLVIALVVIGLILAIAGLVGCVLPIIPGPPLSFIALLLLSYARHWEPFGIRFLIGMGALAALVTILDYVIPAVGAKKYGASTLGVWGSMAGLLIGFFLFSVVGMFIGGFVGAVAAELFAGRKRQEALRAGWGVFVGNLFGIGLKMALSGFILLCYVKKMF